MLMPRIEVQDGEPTGLRLGMRPLSTSRPYGERMVYLVEGHQLRYFGNAEWAEPPDDAVTRTIMDALDQMARFRDVGDATALGAPDLILTGELRRFDEVRTTDPWQAVVEVRLELRTLGGRQPVWDGAIRVEQPIEERTPAGFAEAMNEALAGLAKKVAATLAEVEMPAEAS
jgi:ABC-type uncharacterized transport system auxiliary subunit